jgi:hypothetical protein
MAISPVESERRCETRLLDDAPANEDAFGAHQRVADAITQLIEAEEGGKAVALVGGYGSGKSTIIQLAKVSVEGGATRVFVFDSWSHQGDPLRRSFLEELIRFVSDAGWATGESWTQDLDALAGKREASRTVTNPRLTPAGRAVAVSALLVPVGYLLLANSFADKTRLPSLLLSVPTAWLGFLLALAPLLAVLGVYVWLRPNLRFWTREFWTRHRGRPHGESVWAAFIDRTIQEHHTETLKTPDPTSLEFERIFARLMKACLDKGRTLVVVVDNLDRLPGDEAQTIWATMQTFFGSGRTQAEWQKRLWLVVPFSPDGVARIWSDGSAVSDSFIEKTFQAVFQVSPPILSNWREFFLKSLATAFPSHTNEEFDRIYRLYRSVAAPADKPVTPRELKTFVNQVGVLHRQWHDEISLVVMATFVLLKKNLGRPSDTLTSPDFLDSGVRAILGYDEWPRDFAAMHFNVARDSSVQVLIGRQVETGLTRGSREELSRLAQVPGFEAVCQSVVEDRHGDWTQEDGRSVLNAAAMLMALESDGLRLHAMTELVLGDLLKIQKWTLTEAVGESIVAVATNATDDVRPTLARRLIEQIMESPPADANTETLKDWATGYAKVVRQVPGLVSDHTWKGVGVPGRPEEYVLVLPQLTELISYPETQVFLAPRRAGAAEILRVLSELVTSDRFDVATVHSIRAMLRLKVAWPWDGLVTALDTKARAVSPEVAIKAPLVSVLIDLAAQSVASATKVLASLGSGGFLCHHLHLASVAADNDAASALVLAQLLYNPAGEVSTHVGQSSPGQTLYREILTTPDGYATVLDAASAKIGRRIQVETLIANAENVPAVKTATSRILSDLLATSRGADLVAAEHFVTNYGRYTATLQGPALTELVKNLVSANLYEALVKKGFARELGPLYQTVWSISDRNAPPFETLVTTGLRAMDRAAWSDELSSGQLPELIGAMATAEVELAIGKGLEDALLEYGKSLLAGAQPRHLDCGWPAVLTGLTKIARNTLLRDIRGELVARPDGHIGGLLAVFGQDLLTSGLLVEEADEILRKVGRAIVERGDVIELNWLERVLDGQPDILQSAAQESVASLVERVADARIAAVENVNLTAVLERILAVLEGATKSAPIQESSGLIES